jgi:hypothetical protein
MGLYAVNDVKINIENYRQYWLGTPGIGKTTAFRDLILKEYGDPKYGLLISLGNEIGYKSLDRLTYVDCPDWFKFTEVVDDLIENKKNNEFKLVALDTVDELVYIAEQYALYIHKIRNNGASATSVKSAMGGWGAGKKFAREQIAVQITKLERAGYCLVYIGHTKHRDLNDKDTDTNYQMLTTNMELDYHAIFANRCEIMAMMYTKKTIKDERLMGESRLIRFRGSSTIESKSRVSNLPEEIEFDVDLYLKTIKDTLEKNAGITDKKIAEQKRQSERTVIEEQANEFVEKEQENIYGEFSNLEEYRENMLKLAKALSTEDTAEKKAELKRLGLPGSFTAVDDIEVLKKIYKVLSK